MTQPGNAPKARPSHLTTVDAVNEVSPKDSAFEDLKGRVLWRMQTPNWDTATVSLNLSLTHCRPHPARDSGLFRPMLRFLCCPRFILVEGNSVYSSANLSDHKSHRSTRLPASGPSLFVAHLSNSWTPAGFLLIVCLSLAFLSRTPWNPNPYTSSVFTIYI